ncbi:MAG: ABC transporter ATP-binding protein [Candidatus Bipolaricaulota bacterium]|nr:ABC transporter ATP-binding protein [Candidatus Bipolaricaulota bacterium]MCS7274220.1 ABC transporter ATP-binding protein [Candidatus Bipolaricaulota bacterium]MDW8111513.1 ABC transporter ATP-binding protein [Candidatus Bipolaricaulota bacterium]MDW8329950.1 ABC transporter ATP-binding protein [Candidatus Bipolaricaulota bacterium]
METEFLELREVRLRLAEFELGPLSLAVKKGELVAILGPSGSGKTTLLRLIAGFERPDAGSIAIDGRIVADATRWVEPEDRGVGMVFQDYALFPHLTAGENVAFGVASSKAVVKARVAELLKLVGLDGLAQRYPHELSGGEQQRVALARSLAANPKVLLLDEPFSNLDADLRPKMRAELKLLLQRLHCTTIFVTHDQEEAFELADRIAVLNAGGLEQIDTPERLYREPATRFVAEFIGHADFLKGRVRGGCLETALGCFSSSEPLPEGTLVDVMVRPEEVELEALLPSDGRGEGLIVARRYRSGMQLFTVRLASGEVVRSLQPAGAHFPLASRVRVRVKTQTPLIFPR